MKKYVYSYPILKDNIEEWLHFVKEVNTNRNLEFTEMHARIGVTKESWYLKQTNDVYEVLVYTEAKDENFVEKFTVPKTKCYVCRDKLPCDDEICRYVLPKISHQTIPFNHMFNLMIHFSDIKLDIFTTLCLLNICDAYGCTNHNCGITCVTCRRVVYCSKKCKKRDLQSHTENGGCIDFLKIWRW